jgi:hypothetical protein
LRFATTHTTNLLHAFLAYRFHFNGGEAINEVYGNANYVDLGERGVDTRLGILNWTIDPRFKEYPWQSPYAYYANSPIWQIDYLGMGKLTRYVGEDGKELANTKDGNNSTITVTNDKRVEFDKWKTESEANGTLNNAENNMDMIHSLTPSHKGVYFTNSSFGLKYMTRFSTLENKEYSGYLLKNGLYVDAVEGYDIRIKDYEQNDHSTSGTYTRIVKGKLNIANKTHTVLAHIHCHPQGEYWSGIKRYPDGSFETTPFGGDYQAFKGLYFGYKAGIKKFYLIQGNSTIRVMNFKGGFSEKSLGNIQPYLNGNKKLD